MTNNHPDQIDAEIDKIIEGCHDYIRGLRTDRLIGISKKEDHAAVKVMVLKEKIAELNYWQWKTDGHIELSGKEVDDRISNLEKEMEGMQPQEHEP